LNLLLLLKIDKSADRAAQQHDCARCKSIHDHVSGEDDSLTVPNHFEIFCRIDELALDEENEVHVDDPPSNGGNDGMPHSLRVGVNDRAIQIPHPLDEHHYSASIVEIDCKQHTRSRADGDRVPEIGRSDEQLQDIVSNEHQLGGHVWNHEHSRGDRCGLTELR
jgi:hypothetical protein